MAKTSFKISGLSELGRELKKRGDDMGRRIAQKATASGAYVVREAAKRRAPKSDSQHQLGRRKNEIVQPGNLRANVVMKRVTDGRMTAEYVVGVRAGSGRNPNDAFYGDFVEIGTVKMAAQPYIRPAFDAEKQTALDRITKVLKQEIEA